MRQPQLKKKIFYLVKNNPEIPRTLQQCILINIDKYNDSSLKKLQAIINCYSKNVVKEYKKATKQIKQLS